MKRFIGWATKEFDLPILEEFLNATPTAELEPITQEYVQSDEVDMGMTYDERSCRPSAHIADTSFIDLVVVSVFGRLRKEFKLGKP